jgi:hypothetical protein
MFVYVWLLQLFRDNSLDCLQGKHSIGCARDEADQDDETACLEKKDPGFSP